MKEPIWEIPKSFVYCWHHVTPNTWNFRNFLQFKCILLNLMNGKKGACFIHKKLMYTDPWK